MCIRDSGYPLKDVAAFMGWVSLPFSCQRLWRIYGDPRRSLQLAQRFTHCRNRMARRLAHQVTGQSSLTGGNSFFLTH